MKKLPKKKKIEELERQDKELEKLPDPHKEQKLLTRMGRKLKNMIKPRKVSKKEMKEIKQEVEEAGEDIEADKVQKKK